MEMDGWFKLINGYKWHNMDKTWKWWGERVHCCCSVTGWVLIGKWWAIACALLVLYIYAYHYNYYPVFLVFFFCLPFSVLVNSFYLSFVFLYSTLFFSWFSSAFHYGERCEQTAVLCLDTCQVRPLQKSVGRRCGEWKQPLQVKGVKRREYFILKQRGMMWLRGRCLIWVGK